MDSMNASSEQWEEVYLARESTEGMLNRLSGLHRDSDQLSVSPVKDILVVILSTEFKDN